MQLLKKLYLGSVLHLFLFGFIEAQEELQVENQHVGISHSYNCEEPVPYSYSMFENIAVDESHEIRSAMCRQMHKKNLEERVGRLEGDVQNIKDKLIRNGNLLERTESSLTSLETEHKELEKRVLSAEIQIVNERSEKGVLNSRVNDCEKLVVRITDDCVLKTEEMIQDTKSKLDETIASLNTKSENLKLLVESKLEENVESVENMTTSLKSELIEKISPVAAHIRFDPSTGKSGLTELKEEQEKHAVDINDLKNKVGNIGSQKMLDAFEAANNIPIPLTPAVPDVLVPTFQTISKHGIAIEELKTETASQKIDIVNRSSRLESVEEKIAVLEGRLSNVPEESIQTLVDLPNLMKNVTPEKIMDHEEVKKIVEAMSSITATLIYKEGIDELKEEIKNLKLQIADLQEKNEELKNILAEENATVAPVIETFSLFKENIEKNINDIQIENIAINETLASLQGKNEELTILVTENVPPTTLDYISTLKQGIDTSIVELNTHLNEVNTKSEALTADLAELRNEEENLKNSVNEMVPTLEEFSLFKAEAGKKISDMQTENEVRDTNISSLQEKSEILETCVNKVPTLEYIHDLEEDIDYSLKEINDYLDEVELKNESLTTDIEELKSEKESLKSSINEIAPTLENLSTFKEDAEKSLNEVQLENMVLSAGIAELKGKNESLEILVNENAANMPTVENIATLKEDIDASFEEVKTKHDLLKVDVLALQSEKETLKSSLDEVVLPTLIELNGKNNDLENLVIEHEAALDEIYFSEDELKKKLSDLEEKSELLEGKTEDIEEFSENLEMRISEQDQKIASSLLKEDFEEKLGDLLAKDTELDEKIVILQGETGNLGNQIQTLQVEKGELGNQVQALQTMSTNLESIVEASIGDLSNYEALDVRLDLAEQRIGKNEERLNSVEGWIKDIDVGYSPPVPR